MSCNVSWTEDSIWGLGGQPGVHGSSPLFPPHLLPVLELVRLVLVAGWLGLTALHDAVHDLGAGGWKQSEEVLRIRQSDGGITSFAALVCVEGGG